MKGKQQQLEQQETMGSAGGGAALAKMHCLSVPTGARDRGGVIAAEEVVDIECQVAEPDYAALPHLFSASGGGGGHALAKQRSRSIAVEDQQEAKGTTM